MENLTPEKAKWLAERYYKPDNSAVVFSEWKSGAISARTASKQPGWLERPSANGSTKVWLKKAHLSHLRDYCNISLIMLIYYEK